MSVFAGPPAGWYPDPNGAIDTKRYWDGNGWTENLTHVATAPVQTKVNHSDLMIAGFVAAILLPLIGFVIGIVLLAKNSVGPGIGVLVTSIVATIVWSDFAVLLFGF